MEFLDYIEPESYPVVSPTRADVAVIAGTWLLMAVLSIGAIVWGVA